MSPIRGQHTVFQSHPDDKVTDWKSTNGELMASIRHEANLERGASAGEELFIGFEPLLKKWGKVQARLSMHALAKLSGQAQTPLDLFEEAGLALRFQAVLEGAAGIRLNLELPADQFAERAKTDTRIQGIPGALFEVFLDEAGLEGELYAKVALSLMAYVNLIISGSFFSRENEKPGFSFLAEAGAGMIAGSGYRLTGDFSIPDPQRFVDAAASAISSTINRELILQLPIVLHEVASALTFPIETALRSAFIIGKGLTESSGNRQETALRTVESILQHAKLWMLEYSGIQQSTDDVTPDRAKEILDKSTPQLHKVVSMLAPLFDDDEPTVIYEVLTGKWKERIQDSFQALGRLQVGLQSFLLDKSLLELTGQIQSNSGVSFMFIRESLLPGLRVLFQIVYENLTKPGDFDDKQLCEACSSVLLPLVSTSITVGVDVLHHYILEQMKTSFHSAADRLNLPSEIKQKLNTSGVSQLIDLEEGIREALLAGGDVFRPLPEDTREKIRAGMGVILNPLPPEDPIGFIHKLKDRDWMPDTNIVWQMYTDLIKDLHSRFEEFVMRMMELPARSMWRILQKQLEKLKQAVSEFMDAVEKRLKEALEGAKQALELAVSQLNKLLEALHQKVTSFNEYVNEAVNVLHNADVREAIRRELFSFTWEKARQQLDIGSLIPGGDILNRAEDALGRIGHRIRPPRFFPLGEGEIWKIVFKQLDAPFDHTIMRPLREAMNAFSIDKENLMNHVRKGRLVQDYFIKQMDQDFRSALGEGSPEIFVEILGKRMGFQVAIGDIISVSTRAVLEASQIQSLSGDIQTIAEEVISLETNKTELESLRTNKEAELLKCQREWDSRIPGGLELEILQPKMGASYDSGDIPVQLMFKQMPSDFLHTEGGPDRVKVWLDETQIELNTFEIESQQGGLLLHRILKQQELASTDQAIFTLSACFTDGREQSALSSNSFFVNYN